MDTKFVKNLFKNSFQELGSKITKIELTTDGVLTYFKGEEQPYRGLVSAVLTDNNDFVKRTLMFVVKFPFLFPYYIQIYRATLKKYEFKNEYYCRFIRAIKEACQKAFSNRELEFFNSLMMIFEIDNAYRFRLQDYLNLAGKNINFWHYWKCVKICKQREIEQLRKKWNLLYLTLLFFYPTIKKMLKELDFEKIKWTIEDIYYIKDREDYQFLGLTIKQRNLLYRTLKNEKRFH